jgi:hypothetical protein
MKKRALFIFLAVLIFLGAQASAQLVNLEPLNQDFQTLMNSIGHDVVPHMQQMVLAGDIVGEASFGNFPHFGIVLPGVGVTFGNGIATALSDPDPDLWKFNLLPFPTLIASALGSDQTTKDVFNFAQGAFPYPSVRVGFGIGLGGGFEVLLNGMYLPQSLVDAGLNLIETSATGPIHTLAPQVSVIDAGGVLRKVLIKDKGLFRPSVSIGAGYNYASFRLGANISSLYDLTKSKIEIPGLGNLDLTGKIDIKADVNSAGIDFHVSKRLLIFTPYMKFATWYQQSTYDALTAFKATVTSGTTKITEQTLQAHPQYTVKSISTFLTGGLEVKLLFIILNASVTLDMENPIVDVKELSLSGVKGLNGISVNTGLRIQL